MARSSRANDGDATYRAIFVSGKMYLYRAVAKRSAAEATRVERRDQATGPPIDRTAAAPAADAEPRGAVAWARWLFATWA